MKIFAAHNSDVAVRRHSSSGGIFTLLAEKMIENGGVVYGAAFSPDGSIKHCRVESIDRLHMLRGSKYAFSDATAAYSEACSCLENGVKVLFSGTPCQVAAMRKRAGDNPNLLLVEIVCHGAPQPVYWQKYLTEITAKHKRSVCDIESINFRDKRTGWKNYSFTIKYRNGRIFTQLHDDNAYMRAFLNDFTLREACFRCPFKYPDGTAADITLGDLWGISQLAPQIDNDEGTTLIIARTPAGEAAVSNIDQSITFSLEQVATYNPALVTPAVKPALYETFKQETSLKPFITVAKKYTSRPLILEIKIRVARIIKYLKLR